MALSKLGFQGLEISKSVEALGVKGVALRVIERGLGLTNFSSLDAPVKDWTQTILIDACKQEDHFRLCILYKCDFQSYTHILNLSKGGNNWLGFFLFIYLEV